MADDKVRELAVELLAALCDIANPLNTAVVERILRAELKPLLDAAEDIADVEHIGRECGAFIDGPTLSRLAAELRNWRKE